MVDPLVPTLSKVEGLYKAWNDHRADCPTCRAAFVDITRFCVTGLEIRRAWLEADNPHPITEEDAEDYRQQRAEERSARMDEAQAEYEEEE